MSEIRRYILNPETLMYELETVSFKVRLLRVLAYLVISLALAALIFWIYLSVLGFELPKTALLRKQNAKWNSKMDIMNRELDRVDATLDALELRNDDVYRSIFGMDSIPESVLESGFGGANRYAWLDDAGQKGGLATTFKRLDMLTKKACIQSKSFDEVGALSHTAGKMASCIPAVSPIAPKKGQYHVSSPFGVRSDPIHGRYRHHDGVDFSAKKGTPIYATGDGVVDEVKYLFYGYGHYVVIDHGFGYKTMYAHMDAINVAEGMPVTRGQCIGSLGNSGRSTGSHLHYEVHYRDAKVNPANYYDLDISMEEYEEMTGKAPVETDALPSNEFRFRSR